MFGLCAALKKRLVAAKELKPPDMYAISEEDSFLPAILSSNPVKQLEQVRGYYERQREFSLVLDRNLEEIRMAYCRKLCAERNRLSKSLWELEMRKRRLMHQIMEPQSKRTSDWRRKSVSETKKQRLKKKEKDKRKSEGKLNSSKGEETTNSKQKSEVHDDEQQEVVKLEIPKFLLH